MKTGCDRTSVRGNCPHFTVAMATILTRTLTIHVKHICYLDGRTFPAIHMSMIFMLYKSGYINMTLLYDRNQSFCKGLCLSFIQYIKIILVIMYIYICCRQLWWGLSLLSCATALIHSFIISLLRLV